MRDVKLGLRSLRRRPVLVLAAALFLVAVVVVGSLGSPPAAAQGAGDWTVLLMKDGTVLCADEPVDNLAYQVKKKHDFVALGVHRWYESWVRPEYVTAVLFVGECPKGGIVIPRW